jgi:hypothetical protein
MRNPNVIQKENGSKQQEIRDSLNRLEESEGLAMGHVLVTVSDAPVFGLIAVRFFCRARMVLQVHDGASAIPECVLLVRFCDYDPQRGFEISI